MSYGWPPYKQGVAHVGGSPSGSRSWQPQRHFLRGKSPRCCGRGLAWKALLEAGWHGFAASAAATVAGRRPACPPPARCGDVAQGRGAGGESDPFLALKRHRGGVGGPPLGPPTPPVHGGRSHHTDPCGKAKMLTAWTRVVLLNLALTAAVRRASLLPWPARGKVERNPCGSWSTRAARSRHTGAQESSGLGMR